MSDSTMPPLTYLDPNTAQYTSDPSNPPKKQRCPKRASVTKADYTPSKLIQRVERTYSAKKRDQVLMYLAHETIYDPNSWKSVSCYRKATPKDAEELFKIPRRTISHWWRMRDSIAQGSRGFTTRHRLAQNSRSFTTEPTKSSILHTIESTTSDLPGGSVDADDSAHSKPIEKRHASSSSDSFLAP